MPDIEKTKILELLEKPMELFVLLYETIEPPETFQRYTNEFFTNPESNNLFYQLANDIYRNIQELFQSQKDIRVRDRKKDILKDVIERHYVANYHILCISLFKAFGEYLAGDRRGTLRYLKNPVKVGNLTVTIKPPNPIYKSMENPVREHYGIDMHDITDVCDVFSFIKETAYPKICFLQSDIIETTNSHIRRRIKNTGFRIAITPFTKDLDFEVHSHFDDWPPDEKTPFWFTRIKNSEDVKKFLESTLINAIKKNVDLLVIPELTIDKILLAFLKDWLFKNNRKRIADGCGSQFPR